MIRVLRALALLLFAISVTPAFAQLGMKDICSGACDSDPESFFAFGNAALFSAHDLDNGTELWISNGSAGSTMLVADLAPGTEWGNPTGFAEVNGIVYFQGRDFSQGEEVNEELWRTDGTTEGTFEVKEIDPSTMGSSSPQELVDLNGTLVFQATTPGNGTELWISDGTEDGTVLLKDTRVGPFSGEPFNLTVVPLAGVGDRVFFSADDGSNGEELWISDGTEDGTVLVKDIAPGATGSNPSTFHAHGGLLYFVADDGTSGRELWKSDGTEGGTVLVEDIRSGSSDSSPRSFTSVGSTLFFTALDGTSGRELWASGGTAASTALVEDIRPGATGSNPFYLVAFDGALYFSATDGTNGSELWTSDGTAGGTSLVRDINPGPDSGSPSLLTVSGGSLYFGAFSAAAGFELWKSDGDAGSTSLVQDISPGPASSGLNFLADVNGTLFFRADDGTNGVELWFNAGGSVPVERAAFEALRVGAPWPNPARDAAHIEIAVEDAQRVRVTVYDALGRRAAVALDEQVTAQQARTVVLPTGALASGAYLVRIQGERFAEVRRLTVVR